MSVPSQPAIPPCVVKALKGVLLLQGPELLELMIKGGADGKLVDNQKIKSIEPGWYATKIGKDKKWRNLDWASKPPLGPLVQAVPDNPSLKSWHGCVPALLYFAERRTPEQCNGYAWAAGPNCYPILAAIWLKEPVPIAHRGQALKWKLGEEELNKIEAQMPERIEPIVHDISVLG